MGKVVNMEEKKSKVEAKVETTKSAEAPVQPQKMTYEQLANAANQLSEQGRQLYKRVQELEHALQEANLYNLYKKMDYLWQVITTDTIYLSEEFKNACGREFENLMQGTPEEAANTEGDQKEEE